MHSSDTEGTSASVAAAAAAATEASTPGVMQDVGRLGRALKEVFSAQLPLMAAELGLAKSAVVWMLIAVLLLVVLGVGVAFSALALAGVALAGWFGSWLWALGALAVAQLLLMGVAVLVIRRCMRWMTLPQSRGQWRAIVNDAKMRIKRDAAAAKARKKA